MNRVALDLGLIQIYWYSIFIFLGILSASFVIFKEFKKRKCVHTNLVVESLLGGDYRIYKQTRKNKIK